MQIRPNLTKLLFHRSHPVTKCLLKPTNYYSPKHKCLLKPTNYYSQKHKCLQDSIWSRNVSWNQQIIIPQNTNVIFKNQLLFSKNLNKIKSKCLLKPTNHHSPKQKCLLQEGIIIFKNLNKLKCNAMSSSKRTNNFSIPWNCLEIVLKLPLICL